MQFKSDFLYNYITKAPIPLAIERSLECDILSKQKFARPVLDIGCGEGLFAFILFDEKIDTGIDPDKKELARCSEYKMYYELIHCYGDKIPKESKSFNTIFSNSVLEHIPDINGVLKEAHRLLSDCGKMYVTLPTNLFDQYSVLFQLLSFFKLKSLAEKYKVFFNKFWNHYHYYDIDDWKKLFQQNEFVVLNYKEYDSKFICLLNNFLIPLSLFPFLNKKLFNRWFLLPGLRKLIAKILYKILNPILLNELIINKNNCGLVFFKIAKAAYLGS